MAEGAAPTFDSTMVFEMERRRLFGIAYRMLGSVSEAEDVVQDAYVRWHGVAHQTIEAPAAYLTRLVTRLCLDALKSVQRQRTEYVGPWLPEPLIIDERDRYANPAALHELADDLSQAFLLLLERLTPVERAVFVLHESFGYSYDEIAHVVGRSAEYCRQIMRRARKHLDLRARLRPADPHEHARLLTTFLAAAGNGDLQGMIDLLAHDAVLYSDGGGKAPAARKPIMGAEHVAQFMLGLTRIFAERFEVRLATINGRTGALVIIDGRLQNVMTAAISNGKIEQWFLVVNPDKLPDLSALP